MRFGDDGMAWLVGEGEQPLRASECFTRKLVQVGQERHVEDASGNSGPPINAVVPLPNMGLSQCALLAMTVATSSTDWNGSPQGLGCGGFLESG